MDFSEYGLTDSELEILKKASEEGRLIMVTASVSANGTVVGYTPVTGKQFVMVRASVKGWVPSSTDNVVYKLKNDTNVRESFTVTLSTTIPNEPFRFSTKGDVLVGNSSKKYEIDVSDIGGSATVEGHLLGYIEDT